ncbi:MAG: HEAT repeat domain-containing protein [Elusimicrobiota bacterium]
MRKIILILVGLVLVGGVGLCWGESPKKADQQGADMESGQDGTEKISEEKKEALKRQRRLKDEQRVTMPWKPGDPLTPEAKEWLRSGVEFIKNNMSKNDRIIQIQINAILGEYNLFQVTDMAADAPGFPIKYRSVRKPEEKLTSIAPDVVKVLVEVVKKHKNPLIRTSAVSNLKLIGEKSVIPDLITALKNEEDMLVKKRIAEVLVDLGEKEVSFSTLIDFVRRKDIEKWKVDIEDGIAYTTRGVIEMSIISAMEVLYKKGTKESKSVIREALHDKEPFVRLKAAFIMSESGEKSIAFPVIVEIARNPEVNFPERSKAIRYLENIGDKKAISIIKELVNDKNKFVREKANETLEK